MSLPEIQISGLNPNPSPALTDKHAIDNSGAVSYYETNQQILTLFSNYLIPLTGGTLTGAIINYTNTPTHPLELVPKSYVDSVATYTNGNGITISTNVISANINSTNLKFTTGAINTIQDIDLTASPQFDGLTLTAFSGVIIASAGVLSSSATLPAAQFPALTGDVTTIAGSLITTLGTVAVNKGGTGQTTYTDGELNIGNSSGNTLSKATLTPGSGITITNGNGTITISNSGVISGVTSLTATSPLQVNASTGAVTVSVNTSAAAQFGSLSLNTTPLISSYLNQIGGSQTATFGGELATLALYTTIQPSGGASNFAASLALKPTFTANSAQTINLAAAQYISMTTIFNAGSITRIAGIWITGGDAGAGTISNAYGIYASLPAATGANKHAIHADNISIGDSYINSNAPPSNGAIIQGQVGIGTPSVTANRRLTLSALTADYYNFYSTGTLNGDNSSTASAFYLENTISPTNNTVNVFGINCVPLFSPSSTNTIPVATALFSKAAGSVGSGAVTLAFSGYFAHPTIGTTKISLYAENNIVLGSVTPQGSGITLGHDLSSGGATTKNSYPIYLNGGYWNGSADTSINYSLVGVVDAVTPTAHLSIRNTNATEFINTYLPTNDQGAVFNLRSYGLNTSQPMIAVGGARGTAASPTAVQNGDILGFYSFTGYGTSAWTANTAGMWATATENWTNTVAGSKLSLGATATGSLLGVESISITQNGTNMTATRFSFAKGAAVASTGNLVLGTDGNIFTITGTTTINTLSATNWQAGSIVGLQFASGVCTVKRLGTGTGQQIQLSGGVDFVSTQNTVLWLYNEGTYWFQVCGPLTY